MGEMFKTVSRNATLALVLGMVMAFAACARDDAGTADTGVAMTDTGAAMMGDTAMAAPAAAPLTDENIFYILDRANLLDSASGSIAATKGTNSEIRDYGKMMMREHHGLRERGQMLAKRFNFKPAAPPNDNSEAEMNRVMSMLNSAAKGKDFDKAYIDDQVTYHVDLLDTATKAMAAAQNAELKNFIQKAAPAVRLHLDSAQAIQKKMM